MKVNLKRIMRNKGLTQKDLGLKLGYTPQNIGKYVRGESLPDVIIGQVIAEILGVKISDIWEVE